jgi:site-specific DNA-methyltransferase (adenine-specific)
VRRIAQELGHLLNREEVAKFSRYPRTYFTRKYFARWGEVCAAARTTGMYESSPNRPATKGR